MKAKYIPNNEELKLVNKVSQLLSKRYKSIHKIVLFGSRARGDFRKDSDYDMLVIMPFTETSLTKSSELMNYLNKCGVVEDIEILVRTPKMYEMDGLLKQSIDREGVVLYERDNSRFT